MSSSQSPALIDSPFLRACRGETPSRTPVWFMRQAGRSLPEYLALREDTAMLDSCLRPEMVTEITLQPVRRHGVDAAILFSDIVVPLKVIGVDLDIVPGTGPVIAEPIRELAQLDQLRAVEADDVAPVVEAIHLLVPELDATPLIGFSGAPFTLASYLIEGGPSKDHRRTKAMMYGAPELWHALLSRLSVIAAGFLRAQVEAGASAIQLFDSWAGVVSRADYETYVAPHSRAVFRSLEDLDVPKIHFGVGTGELLVDMAAVGGNVIGVDWRVDLAEAIARLGPEAVVQGNLDPTLVFAPTEIIHERAAGIIDAGRAAKGHIFNLGHGVLPSTDPTVLTRLVEFIHTHEPVKSDA